MAHCPECKTVLEEASDLEFIETDATTGFLKASKRYYIATCAECGTTIGSGVAGAKAGGNSGGAV